MREKQHKPEIVAASDRTLLVNLSPRHIESLALVWGDEQVMSLCGGATEPDKYSEIIQSYRAQQSACGLSVYGVLDKITGELIGTAGFNWFGHPEEAELIYHFRRQVWGNGFAFEAASLCIEIAKNHHTVTKLTASADVRNSASLRVLRKLGFTYTGMKWFEDSEQDEPTYELQLPSANEKRS